uniref:transposase n=1 Tax=Candidatus Enterovibrio escicola TaxID=1927127 RepID=UPI001CC23C00|nr:transposase [Candidatus Enterovibrio escacola]
MLKLMQGVLVPFCSYLIRRQARLTRISFVDSFQLQVYHNLRILRHQVLKVPRTEEKERWGGSTASNYTLLSMTKVVFSQSK